MIVEITYTVKASEANGRRLMKDIDTGRVFWESDEPVVEETIETVVPEKPKRGKRREKKLAI